MQIVPDIWPKWAALAEDLGCSYPTVHAWSHRGIPPKRFGEIIQAAARRGVLLTFEMLSGAQPVTTAPLPDSLKPYLPPQEAAE